MPKPPCTLPRDSPVVVAVDRTSLSSASRTVAHRALKRIQELNVAAGRRATIVDPVYSATDIVHFEKLNFGKLFRYADPTEAERSGLMGETVPPVDVATVTNLLGRTEQQFPAVDDYDAETGEVIAKPVAFPSKIASPEITPTSQKKTSTSKRRSPKPIQTFDLED